MIAACKERIRAILAGQQPPVPPTSLFLGKEGLSKQVGLPKVVMITGRDETKPDGMLVSAETDEVAKVRRYVTRRAVRKVQVMIIIQHRTEDEAEALLKAVVAGLLDGLMVEGQPVAAWSSDTSWADEDSILRREAQANAGVTFEYGLFRTRTVPLLQGIKIEGEVI